MSAPVRLLAPAKVNLGLRVLGRRPDGYHLLESLFVPLDLADEIELAASPAATARVELSLETEAAATGGGAGRVPADDTNLAARAARGFLEASGLALAVAIVLRKRIPAAAGLGGGSSDAGAVLRGLAGLHPRALDRPALARLALGLGADVPYFLDPVPAHVSGVGEAIEAVSGLPALDLVVANPGLELATSEVYAAWDALHPRLTAREAGSTLRALSAWRRSGDRADLDTLLRNDLEEPAVRLCPPVARIRAALRAAGASAVGMSGSGATLYGVFPDAEAAASGAARLRAGEPGAAGVGRGGSSRSGRISGGSGLAGAWVRVARSVGSR